MIFFGIAGQGAKSIAELYAKLALSKGKHILAFPEYGASRQGSPIRIFVRLDNNEILDHSPIEKANIAIILEEVLFNQINIKNQIKKDSLLIINSPKNPVLLKKELKHKGRVVTIDASRFAKEILGTSRLSNTVILGSLIRATKLVSKKEMALFLKKEFSKKFSKEIVDKNLLLFNKGFLNCESSEAC